MLIFYHIMSKRYQEVQFCIILRVRPNGFCHPSDHCALCSVCVLCVLFQTKVVALLSKSPQLHVAQKREIQREHQQPDFQPASAVKLWHQLLATSQHGIPTFIALAKKERSLTKSSSSAATNRFSQISYKRTR